MAHDNRMLERILAVPKKKRHFTPGKVGTGRHDGPVTKPRIESMILMHELEDIRIKIGELKQREKVIRKQLVGQKLIKGDYYNKPIKLYALRLEDNCWYIGMSRNPERRYVRHGTRKGAMWTQLHKPLELFEIKETGLTDDSAVGLLEDKLTLEYAEKYGRDFVRGGGYCQMRPRWPQ